MNRNDFQPGPLADVDCQPAGERATLVFVRTFAHPPEAVWAALIEPDQLRQWAPFTTDRNLARAGEATLTMVDGAGDAASTESTPASVSVVEPPTLLEYTWGTDVLRWELAPIDGGTRLTLRHTVKDRDWVAKVAAGWHLCLVVAEHLLDGDPIPPIRGEAALDYGWDELNSGYAERLGIADTGNPHDGS